MSIKSLLGLEAIATDLDIVDPLDGLEDITYDEIDQIENHELIDDAMNDLNTAGAGLEELYEMIHASLQHGGLSKSEAKYADIAIRATAEKGYINNASILPGLEDFDVDQLQATQFMLEGISDKISDSLSKVGTFSDKWLSSLSIWWNKTFVLAKKYKCSLQKTISTVEKDKEKYSQPKDKKLAIGGNIVKALTYEDKNDFKAIESGLLDLEKVIKSISSQSAFGEHLIEQTKTLASAAGGNINILTIDSAKTLLEKESSDLKYELVKDDYSKIAQQHNATFLSKGLIGDKKVRLNIAGPKNQIVCSVTVKLIDGKKVKDTEELSTLSGTEIITLAKTAIQLLDLTMSSEADIGRRTKQAQELLKANKQLSSNLQEVVRVHWVFFLSPAGVTVGLLALGARALVIHNLLVGSVKMAVALTEPQVSLHKLALSSAAALNIYISKSLKEF